MTDEKKSIDDLPGNHGQFGANNATEDYKPLPDHEDAAAPVPSPAGKEAEKSNPDSGPHQEEGGMRS